MQTFQIVKLPIKRYDIDGYMVSGFETEHNIYIADSDGSANDLPETGNATFTGGGLGTYNPAAGVGYRTSFDATAMVDFSGTQYYAHPW